MKEDLWEFLFRADRLLRRLSQSDLSAAAELAEAARDLEDLAAGVSPAPERRVRAEDK